MSVLSNILLEGYELTIRLFSQEPIEIFMLIEILGPTRRLLQRRSKDLIFNQIEHFNIGGAIQYNYRVHESLTCNLAMHN